MTNQDLEEKPFENWFNTQQTPYMRMVQDWSESTDPFRENPLSMDRMIRQIDFENSRLRVTTVESGRVQQVSYFEDNREVEYNAETGQTTVNEDTLTLEQDVLGVDVAHLFAWRWQSEEVAVITNIRENETASLQNVQHGAFHTVSGKASFTHIDGLTYPDTFHVTMEYDDGTFEETVDWTVLENPIPTIEEKPVDDYEPL